jgi:anti-sigma regulatory factor (Ser/Thr protein kinase)
MNIRFSISATQPAEARRIVRATLVGQSSEIIEITELLTSELVANAIVHGSGDVTMAVKVDETRVRVEVHDFDPTLDLEPVHHEIDAKHGRGLAFVDALASSWGIEKRSAGKAVWFDLDLCSE